MTSSNPAPSELKAQVDRMLASHDFQAVIELLAPRLETKMLLPDMAARLGAAYLAIGKSGEALTALRLAAKGDKVTAAMLCNLGAAATAAGEFAEGLGAFRKAIAINPQYTPARLNLALALQDTGRHNDAIQVLLELCEMRPEDPIPATVLGQCYAVLSDARAARTAFEHALSLYQRRAKTTGAMNEAHQDAMLGLAFLEMNQGHVDAASALVEQVLARVSDHPMARHLSASLRYRIGDVPGAIDDVQWALSAHPGASVLLADRLLFETYDCDVTSGQLLRLAKHLADALPAARSAQDFLNDRNSDRVLKVGFVGSEFHRHPVGWFLLGLLEGGVRKDWEAHIYALADTQDDIHRTLRGLVDRWVDMSGQSVQRTREQIRSDQIDILIDMQGPTAGGDLEIFAARAAPVQIAWGAYPGTTGLDAMDYLIADDMHIPKTSDAMFSEAIIRLPGGYVCYRPPQEAPDVVRPPGAASDDTPITYGCFNSLAKLGPEVLALWVTILQSVPKSRLLIKASGLASDRARQRIAEPFIHAGLADRLILEPGGTQLDMLKAYARVDIALDPFPYSGGVTTLEALWMGVPVVAMTGSTFAGRHSYAHLHHAGFEHMAAIGPDDYIKRAVAWAYDKHGLVLARAEQRAQMSASRLVDKAAFLQAFSSALRTAWQRWCRSEPPRSF